MKTPSVLGVFERSAEQPARTTGSLRPTGAQNGTSGAPLEASAVPLGLLGGVATPTPVSLLATRSKEALVDAAAKVTSKGQVTLPKVVRTALGIKGGDEVIFRVEGSRAVLARTPDFLALAGTIRVPAAKRNVAWDEVIRRTRSARAATRR